MSDFGCPDLIRLPASHIESCLPVLDKKEKSLHESNPDYDVQSAIVMGFDQAHR